MTIENFLERLQGVRKAGHGWSARCPAHDDQNPSLSINVENGRILVHCQAQCTFEAVCATLHITAKDLFLPEAAPRIVATYDYTDESSKLLYQVVRYEPKDFRQRVPVGKDQWAWQLNGIRRVPYRLPEVIKALDILVVEGEKDVESARKLGLVATCNSGGAGKWLAKFGEYFKDKGVTVIADADEKGREHAKTVAGCVASFAKSVKLIEMPASKDLAEWIERGGTREALLELIGKAPDCREGAKSEPPLIAVSVEELLTRDIKPREMLLGPVLPEKGLVMLYAYRGVGKTNISIAIAAAVASGCKFLRWEAPRPRRVLYVDGELPAKTLQERSAAILAGLDGEPAPGFLRFITPDLQDRSMPDLAMAEGQRLIEPLLDGVDLLVLDNLSALCSSGDESEGRDWQPLQSWLLALRRRGISVLFDHHEGKNGSQRGTSKREDLLDTVIKLKSPSDYNPSEGLRCEVHFQKTRAMLGEAAKPFEVRMETGLDGRAVWTWRDFEDAKANQAAPLFAEGMSVREVAEELGISKSQAGRLRRRCQAKATGATVPLSHPPIGVGQRDSSGEAGSNDPNGQH